MGITVETGEHKLETFENADLIILSPGVPHTISPILSALKKGVPITGEIQFASDYIKEPIIAITGTNGKTTVTTLIGEMLKKSGLKVFTGGNIGTPLIEYVNDNIKADVIVLEVSSFQLDTITTFNPKVSVLLNISKDHLDRYDTYQDYILSKSKIFKNNSTKSVAVVSGKDANVRKIAEKLKGDVLFFNGKKEDEKGASYKENKIILNMLDGKIKELTTTDIKIAGHHNIENIAAAALAALKVGGKISAIEETIKDFKGLPHRVEFVTTINNINFYNDSKATNTGAVETALKCFDTPIILIMGGRKKGGGYSSLHKSIQKNVKKIFAIGEAKELIYSDLINIVPVTCLPTLNEAVKQAFQNAVSKDIILLSPSCSSFDSYTSYVQRGEDFCSIVQGLKMENINSKKDREILT